MIKSISFIVTHFFQFNELKVKPSIFFTVYLLSPFLIALAIIHWLSLEVVMMSECRFFKIYLFFIFYWRNM